MGLKLSIEAMQEFVMEYLEQINYLEGMFKIAHDMIKILHDIFAEYSGETTMP